MLLSMLNCLVLAALPSQPAPAPLIDLSAAASVKRIHASAPSEVTFTQEAKGLVVVCRPGKSGYPGIDILPESAVWDLSKFGHVEAQITDVGAAPVSVALRIDDDGDWQTNPWNSETVYLKPGETQTVRVRFGYSWGKPGHALKTKNVIRLMVFTNKAEAEQQFRVETIVAGGSPGERPPIAPGDVKVRPADGVMLGLEGEIPSLESHNAEASLTGERTLRVRFHAYTPDVAAILRPAMGAWDLRDWLQVVSRIRNTGNSPLIVKGRLDSGSGEAGWVASKAIAPGGFADLILPFAGPVITLRTKGEPTAGTKFESDRVSAIRFSADGDGERSFVVDTIRAIVPPTPTLPTWLGKRPPVPGNWKQTLAEEFNGPAIDEKVWTIYHPNYWDKQAHFSKANVILKDGKVRLRFEAKRGHADDDPTKPETDYATGFLTTTHKWTQLYGYFECRMKLPHAQGMWPAFWMMPDRGEAAGGGREDTANGGMEIDVLEYLSRYGPFRYNVATHWDGYDKDHKSIGTDHIYVQPDREGYYTAGVLWEPGSLTFYCNGEKVAQWQDARVSSVPMYVLFTAVSGGWGGNDLTGQGLPDDYIIDYVRVWQREH